MTRLWPSGDPIQVLPGADGLPARFWWQGAWRDVSAVSNRWRVTASWWDPNAEAAREYVKLTTADGLLCILYRDLRTGHWFCARLYD